MKFQNSIMRKFFIPATMFTILALFLSCDKKSGPNANFINQINFKKVQFMDLSKEGDGNIVRWEWSFGDNSTSTEEHPLHTYSKMDTSYSVSLVVTDNNDFSDAITKEVIIPDTAKSSTIGFLYNQSSLFAVDSFEVTFTDKSEDGDGEITSWSWGFGDGNSSTEQNPVHLYTLHDTSYQLNHYFTVSLSITDEFGFSHTLEKDSVKVSNPQKPESSFTSSINTLTVNTYSFTFTGYSPEGNITQYTWDFGDGEISNQQNPIHTYTCSGEYSVTLEITDSFGLNSSSNSTNKYMYVLDSADWIFPHLQNPKCIE